jgi:hypothetical protein
VSVWALITAVDLFGLIVVAILVSVAVVALRLRRRLGRPDD